ncbi:hypothetical protein J2Z21_008989 [Streptomyces griseochromogenes]|uniref:Uncharacterized protein n=1 Tax=Streptomyces griseochromogenes TaxID=68214 RepID=A0ABS4M8H1_9ACTN|nr:hypothetical protein [Streptomyces griseochromogenes]MBP2055972.1 hypothetical protein [Streptomyces griseochromogenes]
MRRDRGLPVLREKELLAAGVDVGPLRRITVVLGRAGGGKWHVPAKAAGWRSHCRYAQHLTGSPLALLDVCEQVCRHCAPGVRVEPGEEALWRAAADVVAADGRVRRLEEQEAGPRSWEGYARVLWEAARHRDAEVRRGLESWTADPSVGAGARQMLKAWSGVLERSETVLAGWRAAAPAAREVTSVSGACDAVAADGNVQRTGQELAAAVLQSRWAQPFDVWAAVRRAWSGVRDQGGEATAARAAAMLAVEAVWGGARVRDVTALPGPALVAGTGFASPAQWADAEFQHRWQQYVLDCCDRLEEALGAAPGDGGDGRQLVLVSGWPLTSKRDAELAYLAQYEQHGPTVPFGGRRTSYGVEPDHAVVLAVPRFAARHAADHTRDDRLRVVLGPELVAAAAEPDERDVLALLRGAYPYLPADAEGDGPGARPTAMVTTARAVRRAAQLGRRAAYSGPDSMEVYNDLVVGKYSWVPDDEHPGPAAAEMENLPVHWLKDWMLCLDVECGMRAETVLHRLYGTVTSYEPGTGRVGFSPAGGHPAILVPVHRIVALTGDRQRRSDGQVPAHEPYEE